MAEMAPRSWGIPIVRSTTDRDTRFPAPNTNQRVQNLEKRRIERWDGTQWVSDTLGVTLSVADFGAVGDGAHDDTSAIQSAIDAAATATIVRTQAVGDVGADSYSAPQVLFPPGVYLLSSALQLGLGFQFYCATDAFLKQSTPSANVVQSGVSGGGYLASCSGIHFIGGGSAQLLVLSRANTDTSMIFFDRCTFSNADPTTFAVDLTLRSAITTFSKCRVLDAPQFLKMTDCDMVVLDDCWVNGYALSTRKKPANTASILVQCSNGTNSKLQIRGGIFVPEDESHGPSNAATRWIDLHDHCALQGVGTQFGGENAGFPIVYNYASAAVPSGSPFLQSGGIALTDCQLSSGNTDRTDRGVVVLQTAIPSRIHIDGGYDLASGYVVNDQIPGGAAAWITANTDANHPRIDVRILGVQGSGSVAIGRGAVGAPSSIADLDAFALVYDCQLVGGLNPLSAPVLRANKRLFMPALNHSQILTDGGAGDGYLAVDQGNSCLAVQSASALRYGAIMTSGLPAAVASFRSVNGANSATLRTVTFTDKVLLVDCTAADVVVLLETDPALMLLGNPVAIKRYTGTHNIILTPKTGTIDGAATLTTTGAWVVFDGTGYFSLP